MIDTWAKNVSAYCGFVLLAVVIGVLQEVHRQVVNAGPFDFWLMGDAAILALLTVLVPIFGAMKLPSVGHENISEKVAEHEDRLELEDPPAPMVAPRGAGQMPEISGRG